MKKINQLTLVLVVLSIVMFTGCASVPKEVVQLSYQIGDDFSSIQVSYKKLVHDHFEMLRGQRIQYLNNEWTPTYIRRWVEDGRLRDVVKGDIVWSEEKADFIKPVAGNEDDGLLRTVNFWSLAAVAEIENKKKELLEPLNKQEEQLTSWIDDVFNRLYRGNATITAHLNSLRKVQEVQDDALAALHMKDLSDKINNTLITASDKAKEGLEAVRKADGLVQETGKKIQSKTGTK
jgi:hypothetical protein